MYWRCIGEGAAVSTPAPGLQTLHPPRLMISSWRSDGRQWPGGGGRGHCHYTLHSPANLETINPHIVFCKIHQQRICAAELDNFT